MDFSIRTLIDCPRLEEALSGRAGDLAGLLELRERLRAQAEGPRSAQAPVFHHALGPAASGKSGLFRSLREGGGFFPEPCVHLSFDALMEDLPAYREARRRDGAERAFRDWELPARCLGYDLLESALRRRAHVALDHSGARADHVGLLRACKETLGYRVVVLEARCPPGAALERLAGRERFTPAAYVLERSRALEELRPRYRELADDYRVFSTVGEPPRELGTP